MRTKFPQYVQVKWITNWSPSCVHGCQIMNTFKAGKSPIGSSKWSCTGRWVLIVTLCHGVEHWSKVMKIINQHGLYTSQNWLRNILWGTFAVLQVPRFVTRKFYRFQKWRLFAWNFLRWGFSSRTLSMYVSKCVSWNIITCSKAK